MPVMKQGHPEAMNDKLINLREVNQMKINKINNIHKVSELRDTEICAVSGGGPLVELLVWMIGYYVSTADSDKNGQYDSYCGETSRTCAMMP